MPVVGQFIQERSEGVARQIDAVLLYADIAQRCIQAWVFRISEDGRAQRGDGIIQARQAQLRQRGDNEGGGVVAVLASRPLRFAQGLRVELLLQEVEGQLPVVHRVYAAVVIDDEYPQ